MDGYIDACTMVTIDTAKKFQFVGGNVALDFCNTMGGKRGRIPHEILVSCTEYLAWCYQAGLLDRAHAQSCLDRLSCQPTEAAAVLERAIALREAIFRICDAYIAGRPPPRLDLRLLNTELSRALGRLQLAPVKSAGSWTWQWTDPPEIFDHPLGVIANAAAKVLTDPHTLAHLRNCNGDNCGWLFIDSSKNHSRRWCDMRDCGNRAKIRRHRLKQKGSTDTVPDASTKR
jgi:predicted RNA-binding Zn ribbon-like protein